MLGYIYKLTLNKDLESFKKGEIYIGKHDGKKSEYFASGSLVKRIVKVYGKEVFDRQIIAVDLDIPMLCFMEVYYIKVYECNRSTHKKGLNLTEGGEGLSGYIMTEEHKNNMKQAILDSYSKGRKAPKAKKLHQYDLETGKYIKSYDKCWDAAQIYNVNPSSLAFCARGEGRSVAGFAWSYEKADQIDLYKLYDKGVCQYTKEDELVKEFTSATAASLALKVSRSAIRNCCVGLIPTVKGFIWKFKKDIENV